MGEHGLQMLTERELGKPFEWVVVQVVRELSGAEPLSGGDYDKVPDWKKEISNGKTLEQWAQDLYETASVATDAAGNKMFDEVDFQNAKVTTIGKQKYDQQGRKIEIKTDIQFGKKFISLKLSGDVQAGSAQGATQSRQLDVILKDYLDGAKETVAEAEARELLKGLEVVKDGVLNLAKRNFISDTRATNLRKTYNKSNDPQEIEQIGRVLQALQDLKIIDAQDELISETYRFDEEALASEVREKINELFGNHEHPLYKSLVKELLTGATGFAHVEGAAAQYLLSPDHAFDLRDPDTIGLFSEVIVLRIALKGGRRTGIPEIDSIKSVGSLASYRWDIKSNLLDKAIERRRFEAQQNLDAAQKALSHSPQNPISEQGINIKKSIDTMFDEAYNDIAVDIVNDFEEELKDSID